MEELLEIKKKLALLKDLDDQVKQTWNEIYELKNGIVLSSPEEILLLIEIEQEGKKLEVKSTQLIGTLCLGDDINSEIELELHKLWIECDITDLELLISKGNADRSFIRFVKIGNHPYECSNLPEGRFRECEFFLISSKIEEKFMIECLNSMNKNRYTRKQAKREIQRWLELNTELTSWYPWITEEWWTA